MALQVDDLSMQRISEHMPQAPQRLLDDNYHIERMVHITGARSLSWGYQSKLDRRVLIERITGLTQAQLSLALARHATLLALEHSQLARCLDIFVEAGVLYLVLATGAGQTLAEATSTVTTTTNSAIASGIQLCNALNFARRQADLSHDITIDPFTAFVTNSGRMKLTSIAALIGIATPRYRSRFAGNDGDSASRTVFSIGATLHFLLTGWAGVYRDGAPSLASLRPDLSAACCQTIMRALHPDPAARWADSAALRYALLPLLD